jgi:hypothetical protein
VSLRSDKQSAKTMGTVNGGTIISFNHHPSLHAVTSRMPSNPNGCANFTFQIPSIANAAKKNTNSAERRANHNAVERARRECLNTKFQELAHALPSLAQVRRPSKSIIVQKSLEFIYLAQQKDKMHENDMRNMRSENDSLREEINKLREKLGWDPLPPREEPPTTPQQADDAKEDAKISSNSNNSETQNEADNQNTINVQGSTCSVNEPIVKTEENRSDDDNNSGNNSDEEFDSDMIDDRADLIYPYDPISQHSGFPSGFDFTLPSMDPMTEATGLPLDFESHEGLTVTADMGTYCDPYTLTSKFYPSPPYEAAMLDYHHITGFSMPESSHI